MIRKKRATRTLVIDLTGPQGNAFCLLGYAKQLAGRTGKPWPPISKDMMRGNYEHLLQVIEREFGDLVIMER